MGLEVGIPLAMGGLGAVGSMLGGSAEGRLKSYGKGDAPPRRADIDTSVLGNALRQIEQQLAFHGGRAQTPITAQDFAVQSPGRFAGGGLPMGIGLSARDIANFTPGPITRPGFNFGEGGPLSGGYNPHGYATHVANPGTRAVPSLGSIQQPDPSPVYPGAGIPEMIAALQIAYPNAYMSGGPDSSNALWDPDRFKADPVVFDNEPTPDDQADNWEQNRATCQAQGGLWNYMTNSCDEDGLSDWCLEPENQHDPRCR
tara:strand:+ start:326 stop:1096 length:771 start_codon:yes stop_codon:yes gene_type:complete